MATKVKATKRTSTRQWLAKACAGKNDRREVLQYIFTSHDGTLTSYGSDGYVLFADRLPNVMPAWNAEKGFNFFDPRSKSEIAPQRGLTYPDVDAVMPRLKPGRSRIAVSVKALRDAVKRAAVFAKADYNRVLLSWRWCWDADANLLTVSSEAVTGGASDVIVCDNDPAHPLSSNTDVVDITVNYRYLLDALTGLGHVDGYVTITLNGPENPLRIDAGNLKTRPGNVEGDRTAVIMPMRRRG